MNDYLLKPVCLEQIQQLVARYINPDDHPPLVHQTSTAATIPLVREHLSQASAANVQRHEPRAIAHSRSAPHRLTDEVLPPGWAHIHAQLGSQPPDQ